MTATSWPDRGCVPGAAQVTATSPNVMTRRLSTLRPGGSTPQRSTISVWFSDTLLPVLCENSARGQIARQSAYSIDGEVLVRHQSFGAFHDAQEEVPRDLVIEQPIAILRDVGRWDQAHAGADRDREGMKSSAARGIDASPPPSVSSQRLSRLRDARSRAETPCLSLISGDAPWSTSHASCAGSNSFSTPWCSAVRPDLGSTKSTLAPLVARNLAARNFFHVHAARNGVMPTTTSTVAPALTSRSRLPTSSYHAAANNPPPGAFCTFAPRLSSSLMSVAFRPRATAKKSAVHRSCSGGSFDSTSSPWLSSRLTIFAACDSAIPRSAQGTPHARCSRLSPRRSVTRSRSGSATRRVRTVSISSRLTASIIRVFDMSRKFMRFSASSSKRSPTASSIAPPPRPPRNRPVTVARSSRRQDERLVDVTAESARGDRSDF